MELKLQTNNVGSYLAPSDVIDFVGTTNNECLAFPIRSEKGELDVPIIFSEPDRKIIDVLTRNRSRTQLWTDLPIELGIEGESFVPCNA